MNSDPRARLPSVSQMLAHANIGRLIGAYGRTAVLDALRDALELSRTAGSLQPRDVDGIIDSARSSLEGAEARLVQRVINATGIVLHTNLGRAPLSEAARAAVADATGPSSVEYDLTTGARGSRTAYSSELVARLCKAPSATVVNNGAAALVLAVAALAAGREVIVSRGELVEIGGSFRLPDIIGASGARLVEVGTTNRTNVDDYRAAIGPNTAMILKVHRSNFLQVGFVADTPIARLVELARSSGILLVHDLGSGLIEQGGDDLQALDEEPAVADSVAAGSDIVIFSGDKLLGGPQAGIIAGTAELVQRCRRHPLARVTRIDKLQLAALEVTLLQHLRGTATDDVPALSLLRTPAAALAARASCIAVEVTAQIQAEASATVTSGSTETYVGGGSAPGKVLTGAAVNCAGIDAGALAAALRRQTPPVIGRIAHDVVVIDLRSVPPHEDAAVTRALVDSILSVCASIPQ